MHETPEQGTMIANGAAGPSPPEHVRPTAEGRGDVIGRSETRPSIGELVSLLSEKTSQLVRDEIRLAKAELADKAKHAGAGVGMFVVAGVFAFFALGTLIASAVLGLANAVPAWLAALIVAVALLLLAGALGIAGKSMLDRASGSVKAVESVKADVAAVKEGLSHERS
ncbi:phage holin family protein [Isoptericola sp. b441]|uniref:Phage holin family protein n=1 Tax=Actinotalea lenta TaxID=3064654 RepID=A0ABT9D555_9CELL|nr:MULTISPECIES: phage holin family protein [unclassified Isoptericola]MDO8105877.1 phage holin family protein [Isoptericola sp. b441]MDO8122593.1 phage holin family protein [Isoptericola sp. b490]